MEEGGVHDQQQQHADPFGYGGCYTTPPPSPPHGASAAGGDRESTPPPPQSPGEEDEGTPKVPLVAWGGRPGRTCPGAPRKGKAPADYFTDGAAHQDTQPVRRLSFGGAASAAPAGDVGSDSMEEDDGGYVHQHQPAAAPAAAPPQLLHISPQAAPYRPFPDDQVLLSPSPPPMQQLWAQQHHQALQPLAPVEQVPMQQHQQQLFGGAPPSRQLRPQQLWPASQQAQPPAQQRALWPGPCHPQARRGPLRLKAAPRPRASSAEAQRGC